MTEPQLPPNAVEQEWRLIASVLEKPSVYPQVPAGLTPKHFYDRRAGKVWEGIQSCAADGVPISDLDVGAAISATMSSTRWEAEGIIYSRLLLSLRAKATGPVAKDAERIIGRAARRAVIDAARQIVTDGLADETEDAEFLEASQGLIIAAAREAETSAKETCAPLGQIVREHFAEMQGGANSEKMRGIRSGLPSLDALTLGWRPTKLTFVGARPGMGKSAIMNTFAIEATLDETRDDDVAVLVMSAEMPRNEVGVRALSSESGIDGKKIQEGRIFNNEWGPLTEAAAWLQTRLVWVDDKARPTLAYLHQRIRRLNHELAQKKRIVETIVDGQTVRTERKARVQVVIVDYIQIMEPRDRKGSRENQITELADGLKAVAKEENCAIIALAQLNRDLEKRPDKRPLLSDMRESGGIEQAADTALLLYRDEYYNKNTEAVGLCEINVAKARGGSTGRIVARFEKTLTKFSSLEAHELDDAKRKCGFAPNE